MTLGLIGRKAGMTRVFVDSGESIPVTVIEVLPNRITRVRTAEADGYTAIQVTAGVVKANRLSKAEAGHFAAAGVEPGRGLWEFRAEAADLADLKAGDSITVERFVPGQKIDVTGVSRGKGYQGAIKRWNFSMQDATHGNSRAHRAPGSIGQRQSPGRVFKGKKMAGHMGNEQVTVQSLEVVRVDAERNLLLVKGAVPGAPGNDLIVCPAVKA
ncbi:MAG: 50S ribosomal protein L3 [Pseudomonadota bacterium]